MSPSGYEGNYVLVPRGRCTFEAKARSAQRLGAAGEASFYLFLRCLGDMATRHIYKT